MVKIKKGYVIAAIVGLIIIVLDMLSFLNGPLFVPILLIGFVIAVLPFIVDFFVQLQKQKELETKFPEFVRNLVGAIKSGMPAPRAIIHIATIDYGALNPYVKKLAHQLEWAIPLHKALQTFADETKNVVIKRAVSSVIEAEQSGGNIEDVLETITTSVIRIKSLKQKRKAAIHSQLVQSYIIFLVFVAVMVIIQNLLIPYMLKLEVSSGSGAAPSSELIKTGFSGISQSVNIDFSTPLTLIKTLSSWFVSLEGVFLMLAMIQSLFAGIILGKLAEGDIMSGLKHSLIMMIISFVIITTAQGFL